VRNIPEDFLRFASAACEEAKEMTDPLCSCLGAPASTYINYLEGNSENV